MDRQYLVVLEEYDFGSDYFCRPALVWNVTAWRTLFHSKNLSSQHCLAEVSPNFTISLSFCPTHMTPRHFYHVWSKCGHHDVAWWEKRQQKRTNSYHTLSASSNRSSTAEVQERGKSLKSQVLKAIFYVRQVARKSGRYTGGKKWTYTCLKGKKSHFENWPLNPSGGAVARPPLGASWKLEPHVRGGCQEVVLPFQAWLGEAEQKRL